MYILVYVTRRLEDLGDNLVDQNKGREKKMSGYIASVVQTKQF